MTSQLVRCLLISTLFPYARGPALTSSEDQDRGPSYRYWLSHFGFRRHCHRRFDLRERQSAQPEYPATRCDRYSIGSTTDGLKKNADGSLDILIQKDKPAHTSNWLPAPAGNFNLTMRFYGPETAVLDGSYRLPAVRRVQ